MLVCLAAVLSFFSCDEDQMRNELNNGNGTYTDADVKEVKKVDCMFVEMAETTQAAINNGDLNLNKASDMVAFFELSYKDGNKEETSKNFTSTTVVKISRPIRNNRFIVSLDDLKKPVVTETSDGFQIKTGAVSDVVTYSTSAQVLSVGGKSFSDLCTHNLVNVSVVYGEPSFNRDSLTFKGYDVKTTYTFLMEEDKSWSYSADEFFWHCTNGKLPNGGEGDDDILAKVEPSENQDGLNRDKDVTLNSATSNVWGTMNLIGTWLPSNTEKTFTVEIHQNKGKKSTMKWADLPEITVGSIKDYTWKETSTVSSAIATDRTYQMFAILGGAKATFDCAYDSVMYSEFPIDLQWRYTSIDFKMEGSYYSDGYYYYHGVAHHSLDNVTEDIFVRRPMKEDAGGGEEPDPEEDKVVDWTVKSIEATTDGRWKVIANVEWSLSGIKTATAYDNLNASLTAQNRIESSVAGTAPYLNGGNSEATISNSPTDVKFYYNNQSITNTLAAAINMEVTVTIEGITKTIEKKYLPTIKVSRESLTEVGQIYKNNAGYNTQDYKASYKLYAGEVAVKATSQSFAISASELEKDEALDWEFVSIEATSDGRWKVTANVTWKQAGTKVGYGYDNLNASLSAQNLIKGTVDSENPYLNGSNNEAAMTSSPVSLIFNYNNDIKNTLSAAINMNVRVTIEGITKSIDKGKLPAIKVVRESLNKDGAEVENNGIKTQSYVATYKLYAGSTNIKNATQNFEISGKKKAIDEVVDWTPISVVPTADKKWQINAEVTWSLSGKKNATAYVDMNPSLIAQSLISGSVETEAPYLNANNNNATVTGSNVVFSYNTNIKNTLTTNINTNLEVTIEGIKKTVSKSFLPAITVVRESLSNDGSEYTESMKRTQNYIANYYMAAGSVRVAEAAQNFKISGILNMDHTFPGYEVDPDYVNMAGRTKVYQNPNRETGHYADCIVFRKIDDHSSKMFVGWYDGASTPTVQTTNFTAKAGELLSLVWTNRWEAASLTGSSANALKNGNYSDGYKYQSWESNGVNSFSAMTTNLEKYGNPYIESLIARDGYYELAGNQYK